MDSQEKKSERVNQKRRTRIELLRSARTLIESGNRSPSIGDVADNASISRATAYRYFSSPEEMIREAVLDGVADAIVVTTAKDVDGPELVEGRLDTLVSDVFKMVVENEGIFRALLSASVTGASDARRGGRRLRWLRETMSPLQKEMPAKTFERLTHALALVTGIEALVVTRDICELEDKDGADVLRWVASTLLKGALAERLD